MFQFLLAVQLWKLTLISIPKHGLQSSYYFCNLKYGGLRNRILHLFLEFIETPEYNPEAGRYMEVHQDKVRTIVNAEIMDHNFNDSNWAIIPHTISFWSSYLFVCYHDRNFSNITLYGVPARKSSIRHRNLKFLQRSAQVQVERYCLLCCYFAVVPSFILICAHTQSISLITYPSDILHNEAERNVLSDSLSNEQFIEDYVHWWSIIMIAVYFISMSVPSDTV